MAISRTLQDFSNNELNDEIIRTYHFSYDIVNWEHEFDNYNDARNYILCVLKATQPERLKPVNESSFILYYSSRQDKLFNFLTKHLELFTNFTISLIAIEQDKSIYSVHEIKNDYGSREAKIEQCDCSEIKKEISSY